MGEGVLTLKMKIQFWPNKAPDKSKPYCLVDSSGEIEGWYASKEAATMAMRKLAGSKEETAMHDTSSQSYSYAAAVKNFAEDWINGNEKWIQMYPFDTWNHPLYGTTTVDPAIAQTMKANFDSGVRGQRLHSDFEHGMDAAKGNKASGTIKRVDVRENGLWGLVAFTDTAKTEIDAGEWNYWSTSHYDTWTHPQTGEKHNYVLDGGALTNKPWVKGMLPLNFSEVMTEEEIEEAKEFAVWTTAFMNNLPDSSFLFVEAGGKKDSEGKTVPRTLRHFPYKDGSGKIDIAHLRNAIARIPQSSIAPALKTKLQSRARALLVKSHAEALMDVVDEVSPEELQEPGTGVIDPDVNRDDSADSGSRLDTPPGGEDGSIPSRPVTNPNGSIEGEERSDEVELEQALREALGIAADVDIVGHVTAMNDELTPIRETQKAFSERKAFSEMFPAEAKRMEQLEEDARSNRLKQFSDTLASRRVTRKEGGTDGDESTAKTIATGLGLSGLAIEKLGDVYKGFSEGNVTAEMYSEALDTLFDNGIVDYGVKGSERAPEIDDTSGDTVPAGSITDIRKAFSEKVDKVLADEFEGNRDNYGDAVAKATVMYPKLAEGYRNAGRAA